jgi:hypothetical protein
VPVVHDEHAGQHHQAAMSAKRGGEQAADRAMMDTLTSDP